MTDEQRELHAKSSYIATMLNLVKLPLCNIDMEHLKFVAKALREQADFEDTIAVLNPGRDPQQTELLLQYSDTLEKLIAFREALDKCTKINDDIKRRRMQQSEINNLFS